MRRFIGFLWLALMPSCAFAQEWPLSSITGAVTTDAGTEASSARQPIQSVRYADAAVRCDATEAVRTSCAGRLPCQLPIDRALCAGTGPLPAYASDPGAGMPALPPGIRLEARLDCPEGPKLIQSPAGSLVVLDCARPILPLPIAITEDDTPPHPSRPVRPGQIAVDAAQYSFRPNGQGCDAGDRIRAACEGKTACSLKVGPEFCPHEQGGVSRFLSLDYHCLDPADPAVRIDHSILAVDGQTVALACSDKRMIPETGIRVETAFVSRTARQFGSLCDATQAAKTYCDGKPGCNLRLDPRLCAPGARLVDGGQEAERVDKLAGGHMAVVYRCGDLPTIQRMTGHAPYGLLACPRDDVRRSDAAQARPIRETGETPAIRSAFLAMPPAGGRSCSIVSALGCLDSRFCKRHAVPAKCPRPNSLQNTRISSDSEAELNRIGLMAAPPDTRYYIDYACPGDTKIRHAAGRVIDDYLDVTCPPFPDDGLEIGGAAR